LRGDEVEPGVAEERGAGDRRGDRHERRALEHRHEGRDERGRLEEVESGPGHLPVVGDVLGGQRRAQIGRPGEEHDRDRAEHEQEPEPQVPEPAEHVGGVLGQ